MLVVRWLSLVDGCWRLIIGRWVAGRWLLVVSDWWSVVGSWWFVADCYMLVGGWLMIASGWLFMVVVASCAAFSESIVCQSSDVTPTLPSYSTTFMSIDPVDVDMSYVVPWSCYIGILFCLDVTYHLGQFNYIML